VLFAAQPRRAGASTGSGIVHETVRAMDGAAGAPTDGFTAFSWTIPELGGDPSGLLTREPIEFSNVANSTRDRAGALLESARFHVTRACGTTTE
jgi:hypothetical protein